MNIWKFEIVKICKCSKKGKHITLNKITKHKKKHKKQKGYVTKNTRGKGRGEILFLI